MNLPYRIKLLAQLGEYILSDEEQWREAREQAGRENGWFIPEFVKLATENIARSFLQKNTLEKWSETYQLSIENHKLKNVGIVMAGNIPLVGFHDFLSVFICGHKAVIKASSKDKVLIMHLVEKMAEWDIEVKKLVIFSIRNFFMCYNFSGLKYSS